MNKYHILYNPLAGNGGCEEKTKALCERLPGDAQLYDVTKITDYRAIFASMSKDDRIVIAGGDGTLNHFINDLHDAIPNEIYYFPAGSGNDFLRDVTEKAENGIYPIGKYLRRLPEVTVEGKTYRFLNGVGYGIDGYCCEVGDELRGKSDKPVNYTSIAIKGLLFHFHPVNATVTVDGVKYIFKKVWLAPTMNGKYYGGGMMPTPDQDRFDEEGKVSLMVLYGSGKLKTLTVFPSIFKGEHVSHTEMVKVLTGHEITVQFDRPTALQIDGETVTDVTEYSVISGALVEKRSEPQKNVG